MGKVSSLLEDLSEGSFNNLLKIREAIWDYATEEGRGSVLWPMRYALSGQDRSPDPFVLAQILGKDETIKRLSIALDKLGE